MMKTRMIAMVAIGLAVACGRSERATPAQDSVAVATLQQERFAPRAYLARPAAPTALAEVVVSGTELPPVTAASVDANMIVRTATASIEVDSLEQAILAVRALSSRVGGYVANSDVTSGRKEQRTATIELKIPAQRFDESLGGLAPIGKLESVSVEAEDVGEEFVDVNARMDNAHRLEQRLIGLLATKTGKLKDVLDVEQALAHVREDIERYEGRIRYLRAHTAMSTLSVTVHEPAPVVGEVGHSVMGEAFAQAWRNFVGLISLGVQSLGVVIPLGALAFLAWIITRRVRLARGAAS
jgi:hypothetical protein